MRKKVLAMLLSASLLLSLLCGCGSNTASGEPVTTDQTAIDSTSEEITETSILQTVDTPEFSSSTISYSQINGNEVLSSQTGNSTTVNTSTSLVSGNTSLEGAAYVMIYNPLIYDERKNPVDTAARSTGSIGEQIEIGSNRAEGLDTSAVSYTMSQKELEELIGEPDTQGIGRATGISTVYKLGDKKNFFYASSFVDWIWSNGSFTCVYAGTYCNIWSLNGTAISESKAQTYGTVFDEDIYEQDVKEFGSPRFADDGGKVNMLFYPFGKNNDSGSICIGFFKGDELYTSTEYPNANAYKVNTNHEIIHMNTNCIDNKWVDDTTIESTMSHEFQHLIAGSDAFESGAWMKSWLNEAMSAYAEDYIYSGIKERNSFNQFFYLSANYRHGQSLYNFYDYDDPNLGDYGVVYLFENYLRNIAGETVFSDIHNAFRNATVWNYSEADSLAESISEPVKETIENSVEYPASVTAELGSDNNVFLSKLTLDFYLNTLSTELGNLDNYSYDVRGCAVYDQTKAANIEGGGRIIVATKDGTFTIPEDADDELIYIGLDENYNVITDAICKDSEQVISTTETEIFSANDFSWNGSLQSVIFVPNVHKSSVNYLISKFDESYQNAGINESEIQQSCTTASKMAEALSDYNDYGFVTIIIPEGTSSADYSELENAMYNLVSEGTFVIIITESDVSTLCNYVIAVDYHQYGGTLGDICSYQNFTDYMCSELTNGIVAKANKEKISLPYIFEITNG